MVGGFEKCAFILVVLQAISTDFIDLKINCKCTNFFFYPHPEIVFPGNLFCAVMKIEMVMWGRNNGSYEETFLMEVPPGSYVCQTLEIMSLSSVS